MKKKILIIDDEPEIGEIVKDFLNDLNYTTMIAGDATEGLALAQSEKPDLVLLDILMPQISGMECLKQIKELRPETIVVVISGLQDEQLAKQAIRRGAYDYIVKPFDLNFLQNNLLARIFPA